MIDDATFNRRIGIALRTYREGAGMGRSELARRVGLPIHQIDKIEEGSPAAITSATFLRKIFEELDVEFWHVIRMVEHPTPLKELGEKLEKA